MRFFGHWYYVTHCFLRHYRHFSILAAQNVVDDTVPQRHGVRPHAAVTSVSNRTFPGSFLQYKFGKRERCCDRAPHFSDTRSRPLRVTFEDFTFGYNTRTSGKTSFEISASNRGANEMRSTKSPPERRVQIEMNSMCKHMVACTWGV